MKTIFRYFLLLGVVIIPLFFLYKEEDQFPILLGALLGVTLTYWIAVGIIKVHARKKQ